MQQREEGKLNTCQTITFGPNEACTYAAPSEYLKTERVCERDSWLLSVSTRKTYWPPNSSSLPSLNSFLSYSVSMFVCLCLHACSECGMGCSDQVISSFTTIE